MSPYLRDLVYWRPVQPDNYVPPKPFYAGFERKISMRFVLSLAWVLLGFLLFFVLRLAVDDAAIKVFSRLGYAAVAGILFFQKSQYRDDVSKDVLNLRDYSFFEACVQVAFAIGSIVGVLYLLYAYEWGLLVFISYWV